MRWSIVTCREFIEWIGLGESLAPSQRLRFFWHLATCSSCRAYLRSYQAALRLARAAHGNPSTEVPEELIQTILRMR